MPQVCQRTILISLAFLTHYLAFFAMVREIKRVLCIFAFVPSKLLRCRTRPEATGHRLGTGRRFDRPGEILRHLLPVHIENLLFFHIGPKSNRAALNTLLKRHRSRLGKRENDHLNYLQETHNIRYKASCLVREEAQC